MLSPVANVTFSPNAFVQIDEVVVHTFAPSPTSVRSAAETAIAAEKNTSIIIFILRVPFFLISKPGPVLPNQPYV
jgi:hypothetical protein